MTNPFVATLRFLGFLVWTLAALPAYLILLACGWKGYPRYMRAYFALVTRILGFHVVRRGVPTATAKPVLFIANHASYLDIIVLGSLLEANFVAKSEVAGWPGFGFLSRIAQTVFVDRKRGATHKERDALSTRLAAGDSLILFPEGTSNDGNRVLPFKSSLFAVAQMRGADGAILPVQPISVAYTRLDGHPMCRAFRPFYAWYGDMTLAGHLFALLGLGQLTVEVVFHPPVTIADFRDRKALANHCHDVIANTVVATLSGRLDEAKITAHRPPAKIETEAEAAPILDSAPINANS
ncbi:MAG: 1-acyl-sn-glycerol-3-phosphate acyltransferase [Rhodospirillaceae bacterium]|nr:1-acyl-sn-glycerol-3-phosphate acyltransferase [Rhodospirillales bacterium]